MMKRPLRIMLLALVAARVVPAAAQAGPGWMVDRAAYAQQLTVVGSLRLNHQATGDGYVVGAFVGEACRGVAESRLVSGQWLHFLTVYGNVGTETVRFRGYVAADDRVVEIDETIPFTSGGTHGTASSPFAWNAFLEYDFPPEVLDIPDQTVEAGESFAPLDLDAFLAQLDADEVAWSAAGYDHLEVSIDENNVVTVTAPGAPEWTGAETVTFTATEQTGEQKSASDAAVFTVADIDHPPEVGDLGEHHAGAYLTFDPFDLDDYLSEVDGDAVEWSYWIEAADHGGSAPDWSVEPHGYTGNMSVVARVAVRGRWAESPEFLLGAFLGDECRGVARPVGAPGEAAFWMTVSGHVGDGALSFRLYDAEAGEVVPVYETVEYAQDAQYGGPGAPLVLRAGHLIVEIDEENRATPILVDPTWAGRETAVFQARDRGSLHECAATGTARLIANPYPPVLAVNAGLRVDEGATAALTPLHLQATDPDHGPAELAFAVVTGPAHGALTLDGSAVGPGEGFTQADIDAGRLAYAHDGGELPGDSFTFTAADEYTTLPEAVFSIAVSPVNDPPAAVAQEVETDEDASLEIVLSGQDPEEQELAFALAAPASHGQVEVSSEGLATYTPAADYNGPDAFRFTVSDGELESEAAEVAITVRPVNDPPVAEAQAVETDEEVPLEIVLSGQDPEQQPLTFALATPASHAEVEVTAEGLATYTPAAEYNGPDAFRFTVSDGELESEAAEVAITVRPVNDPPVAEAGEDFAVPYETPEATPVSLDGTGSSDPEDDPLTFRWLEDGVEIATGAEPTVELSLGSHTIALIVRDGQADSEPDQVVVQVVDADLPVIALLGEPEMSAECCGGFADPGATAWDLVDGDLTAAITVTGAVDTDTPGTYTLTYRVNDSAGNEAQPAVRTVHVVDTASPAIDLLGVDPLLLELGTPYEEAGAAALDACYGDVSGQLTISGSVDESTEGEYAILYQVSDPAGNAAEVSRTVRVVVTPNSYGLIAINSMSLKADATVHSGFIGVADHGMPPFAEGEVELVVGAQATTAAEVRVSAPRVRAKNKAAIGGTLVYTELVEVGPHVTIGQEQPVGEEYWPLFAGFGLPEFRSEASGTVDVEVGKKETVELAPEDGPFGQIRVRGKGILIFTGGEYRIDRLEIDTEAMALARAPCSLLIEGGFSLATKAHFGPEDGETEASDILVYVNGTDGPPAAAKPAKKDTGGGDQGDSGGDDGDDGDGAPGAVTIGTKSTFQGNLYAPHGTLSLGNQAQAAGSFIGLDVIVGTKTEVLLQSGWCTPGVLYEPPPVPQLKPAVATWGTEDLPPALLLPNYPNPFNPSTALRYALSTSGYVRLEVYNALGQRVRVLVDRPQPMGVHSATWDGRDEGGVPLASGIYFGRLVTRQAVETRRMLLMK
ncbi:MAG: Ig-like domain-containing protein [Gemmatimonadota bacterium]